MNCSTFGCKRFIPRRSYLSGSIVDRAGVARGQSRASANQGSNSPSRVNVAYKVKPGDSACRIAARYDVLCQRLIADNALGKEAIIKPGQILQISGVDWALAASTGSERASAESEAAAQSAQSVSTTKTRGQRSARWMHRWIFRYRCRDLMARPFIAST